MSDSNLALSAAASAERTTSVQRGRTRDGDERRLHFTDAVLRKLAAEPKPAARVFYFDDEDKALWAYRMPSGVITLVHQHGRNVRKALGRHPALSVAEARKLVKAAEGAYSKGEEPYTARTPAGRITLAGAVEQYVDAMRKGKRKGSRPATPRYIDRVTEIFDPAGTYSKYFAVRLTRGLWDLTMDDARDMHVAIRENHGHRTADEIVRQKLGAVIELQCERMLETGVVKINVTRAVKKMRKPKSDSKPADPFTADELKRYVGALSDWPRDCNIVHRYAATLQLLTGFRRGRILALRKEHDQGDHLHFFADDNLKAGREFKVPVTQQMREVIDAARALDPDGEFLFPGTAHKKAEYDGHLNSDVWWHDAFDTAKIPRKTGRGSHRVRRTVSTWLSKTYGGTASSWTLDHSAEGGAAVTSDSYINHFDTGDAREWLEGWNEHLAKKLKLKI